MTMPSIVGEALFGTDVSAAGAARAFLHAELDHLDLGEQAIDTTILLLSELVTNAVLHARTDVLVRYQVHPHCIRIEVLDGNSRLPAPVAAPVDATSGRGLALVQALADNWGIERTSEGKAVWFEIPLVPVAA